MPRITKQRFLTALRSATPQERVGLLASLPPAGFRDATISLAASDNPSMTVIGLVPLIQQYCYGSHPEIGAELADATHERARELWDTRPNHGLIATTLSNLACSHAKALSLMGRSAEVLEATDRYIPIYETLQEHENLPTLKTLRVEALVNLKRIDEASRELEDRSMFDHPVACIEAERLKRLVDGYRADVTNLRSRGETPPLGPSLKTMLAAVESVVGSGSEGRMGDAIKEQAGQLRTGRGFDARNPEDYGQLLDTLGRLEGLFTRGGEDSELTVRGRIRNASAIFVHGTPGPAAIEASLAQLRADLEWTRKNRTTELENDALWGIYLCLTRLQRPSEAADALVALRTNLETLRSGIGDPLKRGGIFGTYRYLFNALCEQLYEANRPAELLEAIESSKGRAIADRLTAEGGDIVEDSRIYSHVEKLPQLARSERFHYLTYFVDEERVYSVLVSKGGTIHALEAVAIRSDELREAAESVAPESWNQPLPWSPGKRTVDMSARLAPLVAGLEELLTQGVVSKGDHVCYSSDEDFQNVPLQYLRFRDGIVLDYFSVSRVHSAFHLDKILGAKAQGAPERYFGVVTPDAQDLKKQDHEEISRSFDAPLQWLQRHLRSGSVVRHDEATLARVQAEPLRERVVHFSTHGSFPRGKGNPYHDSYLLLAGARGSPDRTRAAAGDRDGWLTPVWILSSGLDLRGSHVSMMACVSGLAREGIAGDMLGLDWALIQAGATSVISTHWEVGAASAARFFCLFYEKWIERRMSRADAYRQTVLELLGGGRGPDSLQWSAGFSLTGDFR